MPVTKPGFAFKYFDKAILALAVLGLLFAGYMAWQRTSEVSDSVDLEGLPAVAERLEDKYQQEEQVDPAQDFIPRAESALAGLPPDDRSLRRFVFWPPIPDRSYDQMRVGVGRRVVLDFHAPITPGSITVRRPKGVENPIDILEHPYQGDFSQVEILTKPYPESYATIQFTLVGREGKVPHLRPLIVDRTIDKTPYAPLNLTAEVDLEGVLLSFETAPQVAEEDVDIVAYEVFRKDWSRPMADYVSVGEITPGSRADYYAEDEDRDFRDEDRPDRDERRDRDDRRDWRERRDREDRPDWDEEEDRPDWDDRPAWQDDQDPEEGEEVPRKTSWRDANVVPGKRYTYRVRTVGANTFPARGNLFTDTVWAIMPPRWDVRVMNVRSETDAQPARATVQVMRLGNRERDDIAVERMENLTAGDAIAPVVIDRETGERFVWNTGMVLLKAQGDLRSSTSYFAQRIIFVDPNGAIQQRWKGEVPEQTKAVWERVREAPMEE